MASPNKKKTKPPIKVKTRQPKKKDDDIFGNMGKNNTSRSEQHPFREIVGGDQPTQPTIQTQPTQPTAPAKNFSKVANSVTKGITENLFKGFSKQTYDVLYSKTRGAIKPSRFVTLPKKDLESLTGFSGNTLSKHLSHLKSVGLIKIELNLGQHKGSTYEVIIPDERVTQRTQPTQPNQLTEPTPKSGTPPTPESGESWGSLNEENKDTYESPKTFFKDFKYNDDEIKAFQPLLEILIEQNLKLTGKLPSIENAESWKALGETLKKELVKAANKTESISDVPKFLATVLERKGLNAKPKKFKPSELRPKTDTAKVGEYIPDPIEDKRLNGELDEKEIRNDAFNYVDFFDDMNSFSKFYSKLNWQNLLTEIEKLKVELKQGEDEKDIKISKTDKKG